jgi:response regulator RpfG family c-di-GMP phosphodiesterase
VVETEMNSRVLLVDDPPELFDALRASLQPGFELHVAASAAEALEACRSRGPFAVVVSDHGDLREEDAELFATLGRGWPDTARIVLAESAEVEAALRAHQGAFFRLFTKPVAVPELGQAVLAAAERFRRIEGERLLTEQLQFSRESLLGMTDVLERRLAQQLARLRGLQALGVALSEAADLEEVVRLTAAAGAELLGPGTVHVWIQEPASGHEVEATRGDEGAGDVLVVAVRTAGCEIGAVRVQLEGAASEADRGVVSSLASSAAMAAHRLIHRRERDQAQHATIFALARLAEYRDDETGRHLERVSAYCRTLAEGLRDDGVHVATITPGFVDDLVLSAPLHDIGKVGIPDAILHKPGPLTEEEWATMRRHPAIGAETLRRVLESSGERSFLRMAHDIAWCHHERWDGTGYPRGVRGEEIPLSARIMALADCYDALTTRRPYKGPWTHAETRAHVEVHRGKHFDPAVADAFLRREAVFDRIRQQLADEG